MLSHYRSISKLSKTILISTVTMAVLTILLLIYLQRPLDIVISFLVFLQPLVILYFVYWRARRQYASLDFVIKCFAVGYYITTTQSIVLELLLQTICGLLLIPFVRNFGLLQTNEGIPQSNMNNDYKDIFVDHRVLSGFNDKIDIHHNNLRSSESTLKISNHFQKTILSTINNVFSLHNSLFNSNVHGTINIYSSPTPTISWLSRYSVKNAGNLRYSLATDNPIDPNSSNNDPAGIDPEKLRKFGKDNIVIIIVGCLLMAFIVAAAVEETMKHFVVRCCRFPTQLKDPHTVLGT